MGTQITPQFVERERTEHKVDPLGGTDRVDRSRLINTIEILRMCAAGILEMSERHWMLVEVELMCRCES